MSLARLVYYSAIIGGWSAFVGWLLCEPFFPKSGGDTGFWKLLLSGTLMSAVVGAGIGGGLSQVAGLANLQWKEQLKRLPVGLLGGFLGGLLGGLISNLLYISINPQSMAAKIPL